MKTSFGIRSNVATVAVASIYLIISLHISIYEIKYFNEYDSMHHDGPHEYLLIDTNKDSFHIISLILSLSCLLSSLLLILGIVEERYGIIRPWLLFNFVLKTILISIFIYFLLLFVEVCKNSWLNACGLLVIIFFVSVAAEQLFAEITVISRHVICRTGQYICYERIQAFHIYLWSGIYCLYDKYKRQSLHFYRVPDYEDTQAVTTV